ncbi:MAG: type II toxin-antitoxin system VapC family toxin [Treponema sp.]|jgi:tRNA(fMet)-specific endonuclease VapC|nr:type II toxin-antitoxin system VapC family toxin [Treponema sp.]
MYLLDTNICIYIINKHPSKIITRLEKYKPSEVKISSITVAEMEYGASKSEYREKNRKALKNFLSPFEIINFDSTDAEIYGIIRAELERTGNIIGPYDMQLAAQALSAGYVFVTNNIREFKKVKNLKLENWI